MGQAETLSNAALVLLTVKEVAEMLRTTPKAVYAMIERARLPGVRRIGRRLLVARHELVHWLNTSCAPSPRENRR